MARLRFLYVIHTTADVTDADTDGNFELVVFSPVNPQAEIGEFGFPTYPTMSASGGERTNTGST
jgi:hypothetical protein